MKSFDEEYNLWPAYQPGPVSVRFYAVLGCLVFILAICVAHLD